MGNSCSVEINIEINHIIWIDPETENEEIKQYAKELESLKTLRVKLFTEIDQAIDYLKTIKFRETKVIVNGGLYSQFIRNLKINLEELYVAPKIIVYTSDTEKFIENNKDFKKSSNVFYKFGGVANTFKKLKQFISNERDDMLEMENKPKTIKEPATIPLIIEYIDSKEKLMLPILFKSIMEEVDNDYLKKYTNILNQSYSNENDEIKSLLFTIEPMTNIPLEILSKYYARIYTVSSNFQQDILKIVKRNKFKGILPFVQTLYQGLKLKSFQLCNEEMLYRGCLISDRNINIIRDNISKKVKHLPSSIIYSEAFLTFTKDRNIAEKNLLEENKPLDYSKVLFLLEKEDNLTYGLSTHCDLEKISYFPNQKEVLFFPFSSFEIKSIKTVSLRGETIYEIKLLFLDKYLGFIEIDKNLIVNEESLPNSLFKNYIQDFGLISKTKLDKCYSNTLYSSYKKYEEEIKNKTYDIKETIAEEKIEEQKIKETSIKETEIKFDLDSIEENDLKENLGFIFINPEDVNKDIQIINSFENVQRLEKVEEKKSDFQYKNENEIKDNIEIKINDQLINFSYTYRFEKPGVYKIEYIIKKKLTNINHLFYNCTKLTNLYLPILDTQNVINMSSMFFGCNSLTVLSVSNFDTQNVTDMQNVFRDCKSLINLNLANFKTRNVISMLGMFFNCKSLINLDISNFNTQNVVNMSEMFFGCSSLISLDLTNFNTQNVINMIGMFNGCSNLKDINLSTFNTQNVSNMFCMFCGCGSLKTLNLSNFKTQSVTNMYCMFLNCKALKNLNLSNFNTINVTDINWMFNGCNSLTKNKIITKDKKIIKIFETQRVFIFNKNV